MTTQEGATMDTGEAVDKLWDDDTMLTRYRVAFDKNPDVHLWGFLCWLRDDMLKAATRRREATTMQDETVGDKQLMLAAEAIVVGKFGIYAVYRELQRVRDDALATKGAEMTQDETVGDGWTFERIQAAVEEVAHNVPPYKGTKAITAFQAEQLMGRVRNDMQATIATQAALIEQLTQELRTIADAKEAATADEPGYFGSTTWKGWTVDLYSGDDDDE